MARSQWVDVDPSDGLPIGEYRFNPHLDRFAEPIERFQLDLNELHPLDHELTFQLAASSSSSLVGLADQSRQRLANRLYSQRVRDQNRASFTASVGLVYQHNFSNIVL